jgi:hypothetical protein
MIQKYKRHSIIRVNAMLYGVNAMLKWKTTIFYD